MKNESIEFEHHFYAMVLSNEIAANGHVRSLLFSAGSKLIYTV